MEKPPDDLFGLISLLATMLAGLFVLLRLIFTARSEERKAKASDRRWEASIDSKVDGHEDRIGKLEDWRIEREAFERGLREGKKD